MKSDSPEPKTSGASVESLEQVYALQRQGRNAEAEERLSALLFQHPDDPVLHRTLAFLAQHDGRAALALQCMREAVRLAPRSGVLQLELGQVLAASGEGAGALDAFAQAVSLQPDLVDAWALLGITLYREGRDAEALSPLRRAYGLAPDSPDVVRALAETEFALEHYEEALPLFARLSAHAPGDIGLRLRLGRCYSRTGFPERALSSYRDALEAMPRAAELWAALAQAQEDLGDVAAARQAYEHAHELQPGWADPIGGLLMLHRAEAPASLIEKATALLQSEIADAQRSYLNYALGKVRDARGEYQGAMAHWQEANLVRRREFGALDLPGLRQHVADAKGVFTPALFETKRPLALVDARPVFVVGMQRSGTSLVEQIIATHPQAHGAGELTEMVRIASDLSAVAGVQWPRDAAQLDAATLQRLGQRYLDVATRQAEPGVARVVDKQPYNFFHVGLAALLFPQARVIWCRRDLRDVSLSIYSENFAAEATFATDFGDIRHLIDAHTELMHHWQEVSALPILEVQYETLVADIEAQSMRIIDFVGLPWDDACLQFHANPRAVQTFSRWQVRQPVHSRSVGRWRNYSNWLPDSFAEEGQ